MTNAHIRTVLIATALILLPIVTGSAMAQAFKAELGGEAVTRYNWRGLDLGDAASVQPYLRCEFHGLKSGFWGSYSPDFEEIDTWASYTLANPASVSLTAVATDYYFPSSGIRLFNFRGCNHPKGPGAHLLELGAAVSGPAQLPLTISAYVNVHNDPGNNVYMQLDCPVSVGDVDMGFFVGATTGSKENPAAYGSDDFAVINIGVKVTRNVNFGGTDLTLSTSAIVNPRAEIAYLVLGMGI
jgi:hypothetical protein